MHLCECIWYSIVSPILWTGQNDDFSRFLQGQPLFLLSYANQPPVPLDMDLMPLKVSVNSCGLISETDAISANPSTSAQRLSSDRALTPPLPATESGKVEAKFEWPSDVELIERVESDPDWPSDVELIAPHKRKASRTVIQGDVK